MEKIMENILENENKSASFDVLKLFYSCLENESFVNNFRAYMKQYIFNSLKQSKLKPMTEATNTIKQQCASPKMQSLNLLIADYLVRQDFFYTLSVFSSEAPFLNNLTEFSTYIDDLANDSSIFQCRQFSPPRFQSRDVKDILECLGLSPHSEESITARQLYMECDESEPLILCLIKSVVTTLQSISRCTVCKNAYHYSQEPSTHFTPSSDLNEWQTELFQKLVNYNLNNHEIHSILDILKRTMEKEFESFESKLSSTFQEKICQLENYEEILNQRLKEAEQHLMKQKMKIEEAFAKKEHELKQAGQDLSKRKANVSQAIAMLQKQKDLLDKREQDLEKRMTIENEQLVIINKEVLQKQKELNELLYKEDLHKEMQKSKQEQGTENDEKIVLTNEIQNENTECKSHSQKKEKYVSDNRDIIQKEKDFMNTKDEKKNEGGVLQENIEHQQFRKNQQEENRSRHCKSKAAFTPLCEKENKSFKNFRSVQRKNKLNKNYRDDSDCAKNCTSAKRHVHESDSETSDSDNRSKSCEKNDEEENCDNIHMVDQMKLLKKMQEQSAKLLKLLEDTKFVRENNEIGIERGSTYEMNPEKETALLTHNKERSEKNSKDLLNKGSISNVTNAKKSLETNGKLVKEVSHDNRYMVETNNRSCGCYGDISCQVTDRICGRRDKHMNLEHELVIQLQKENSALQNQVIEQRHRIHALTARVLDCEYAYDFPTIHRNASCTQVSASVPNLPKYQPKMSEESLPRPFNDTTQRFQQPISGRGPTQGSHHASSYHSYAQPSMWDPSCSDDLIEKSRLTLQRLLQESSDINNSFEVYQRKLNENRTFETPLVKNSTDISSLAFGRSTILGRSKFYNPTSRRYVRNPFPATFQKPAQFCHTLDLLDNNSESLPSSVENSPKKSARSYFNPDIPFWKSYYNSLKNRHNEKNSISSKKVKYDPQKPQTSDDTMMNEIQNLNECFTLESNSKLGKKEKQVEFDTNMQNNIVGKSNENVGEELNKKQVILNGIKQDCNTEEDEGQLHEKRDLKIKRNTSLKNYTVSHKKDNKFEREAIKIQSILHSIENKLHNEKVKDQVQSRNGNSGDSCHDDINESNNEKIAHAHENVEHEETAFDTTTDQIVENIRKIQNEIRTHEDDRLKTKHITNEKETVEDMIRPMNEENEVLECNVPSSLLFQTQDSDESLLSVVATEPSKTKTINGSNIYTQRFNYQIDNATKHDKIDAFNIAMKSKGAFDASQVKNNTLENLNENKVQNETLKKITENAFEKQIEANKENIPSNGLSMSKESSNKGNMNEESEGKLRTDVLRISDSQNNLEELSILPSDVLTSPKFNLRNTSQRFSIPSQIDLEPESISELSAHASSQDSLSDVDW